MAGCWAVILLCSRRAGSCRWASRPGPRASSDAKLGELSRGLGIEPVLLEYQEPGIIYEIGHPVALIRDRDGFFAHVAGGRSVATRPARLEIPVMRSHFGLDVRIVDEIQDTG